MTFIYDEAVGSLVSAVVANLMMEELEQKILEAHENWLPWYWNRYVDDTFTIVHKNMVDHLLGQLGQVFPAITSQSKQKKKAN